MSYALKLSRGYDGAANHLVLVKVLHQNSNNMEYFKNMYSIREKYGNWRWCTAGAKALARDENPEMANESVSV